MDCAQPSADGLIGDFIGCKVSDKELVVKVVASLIGDESSHDWVMDVALFYCCILEMAFIVPENHVFDFFHIDGFSPD